MSGDRTISLPAETFNYLPFNPTNIAIIVMTNAPFVDLSNPNIQLVDINGDALPDILDTSTQPHTYFLNLGTGQDGVIHWSGRQYMQNNVGVYLQDATAELADMEGRGRPNLVSLFGGNNPELFSISQNLEWQSKGTMTGAGFSLSDPNVRLLDANGDRFIDAMETSGSDILTWININATSWSSPFITSSPDSSLTFDQPTTRLADMNGDGMMDLIHLDSESCYYYMGLGYGQFGARVTMRNPPTTVNDATRLFVMDVNGDGLADVVQVENDIRIYLNKGLDPGSTNSGSFADPIIFSSPYVNSFTIVRSADMDGNGVRDIVLNVDLGNGPQLAYISLSGLEHPNQIKQISNGVGMSTTVGYGSSVVERVRDQSLGKAWPDPVPLPISIVNNVLKDTTFQQSLKTMHYHNGYYDFTKEQFRGFSRAEVTDHGDSSIPNLVTCYQYDVGKINEALKGKLLVEEAGIGADTSVWPEYGTNGTGVPTTLDIPFLFYREQNVWQVQIVVNTATNDPRLITLTAPTNRVRQIFELGAGIAAAVSENFQYDPYGNLTLHAELGRTNESPASQRITTNSYSSAYSSNVTNWILDRVITESIHDGNGITAAQSLNYYDGNQVLGLLANGDLTKTLSLTLSNHYATTINKNYDQYGNVIDIYDPLYGQSSGHYREIQFDSAFHSFPIQETIHTGGTTVESLVATALYDSRFGVITNFIDFNNNVSSFDYDALGRLEGITKVPDTNHTLEYTYLLGFGTSNGKTVNWVETRSKDSSQSGGYVLARTFFDGAGGRLMTKQQAEPAPGMIQPRAVVSAAVVFNSRNKPNFNLNPCFSVNSGDVSSVMAFEDVSSNGWLGQFVHGSNVTILALANADATLQSYDALLRNVTTTNPDHSYRRAVFMPLQEQDYDEDQADPASANYLASKIKHQDGLGRLVQLDEVTRLHDDGSMGTTFNTWSTFYAYDINNNLTGITDSLGNQKIQQFDGLKRKQFMNDPDRGMMRYVYDDASDLIATTDARNQTITYGYDGANRLVTETYASSNGPPAVVYHYDVPSQTVPVGNGTFTNCFNTLGRLASVNDLSGEEHTSYDSRGRVAFIIKRLPDPQFIIHGIAQPSALVSYRTAFAYDSQDRITSVVYPDDDQVGYIWNERSLLKQIPGGPGGAIVSNVVYTPFGLSSVASYGNGVQTFSSYDSRLRLSELVSASSSNQIINELIHYKYDFDPASNIRMIEDWRPTSSIAAGNLRRNTQIFNYDDLYRLNYVGYVFGGPGATNVDGGFVNYRYDRIGNMLTQSSSIGDLDPLSGLPVANLGTMVSGGSAGTANRIGRSANGPPGPHALSSITSSSFPARNYPYDANGNMLVIDGLTNTWDIKNRLVATENSQMSAAYTYDYAGRRVMKVVQYKTNAAAPKAVLYVSKYFEVRENDAPTKFVWNGNTRLARVTGSLSSTQRVQRVRLWLGMNLLSVAVSGATLPLGTSPIVSAYTWQSSTLSWLPLSPGTPVTAGSVLWLQANTNTTLALSGTYSAPTSNSISVGPSFMAVPGLESLILTNLSLNGASNQWHFDAVNQAWQISVAALTNAPGIPPTLSPGDVLFVKMDAADTLVPSDPTLRFRYYLNDHLSSTDVMADSTGSLIEESTMYPFGHVRNHFSNRGSFEPYNFIGKELDAESQLHCFGARYLDSVCGRFISVDPMVEGLNSSILDDPQNANVYAYAKGRPITYVDQDGRFAQLIWGAALGLTFDVAGQIYAQEQQNPGHSIDLGKINFFEALSATAIGAISGGVSVTGEGEVFAAKTVGQQFLKGIVTGATSGMAQETSNQLINKGTVSDQGKILNKTISGGVSGAISGVIGNMAKGITVSSGVNSLMNEVKAGNIPNNIPNSVKGVLTAAEDAQGFGEKSVDVISNIKDTVNDVNTQQSEADSNNNSDNISADAGAGQGEDDE
ncbi:MAG TPA: toxin TcdB middle/N-terminal domain-containing protein [Candidatus Saccharimonadales bacterium]|nr:toxin TcdB middle/N-terminal domain-containing protein [Candidatus Saccharimonadales bacterium]